MLDSYRQARERIYSSYGSPSKSKLKTTELAALSKSKDIGEASPERTNYFDLTLNLAEDV